MASAAEILKRHGIALTGGIGTGKSTVARLLAGMGVPVIDADRLARDVMAKGQPALTEIVQVFGPDVLTPSGELDRKRLGEKVFADPEALKRLEAITHPRIREALAQELDALGLTQNPRPFIYEASLIYENRLEDQFRAVWVTTCPEVAQIRRVMERDGVGEERVRQILAAQMPVAEKAARADLVIDTDRPLAAIQQDLALALK
jgi:dephospho-CoA kinase